MSQKNQFNMYDTGDMPMSSTNLKVEQVNNPSQKSSKIRIRKATKKTDDLEKNQKLSSQNFTKQKEILDDVNSKNIRQYRQGTRRNRLIIITLVILLIIAITVIIVYANVTRYDNNCFLYVKGGSASYYINGKQMDEFRAPQNIQGNRTFEFNLDIDVGNNARNVKFTIKLYQSGKLLDNIILYDLDHDVFTKGNDGYYYSKTKLSNRIDLCGGVVIDIAYEDSLNINNFKMEVYTYLY